MYPVSQIMIVIPHIEFYLCKSDTPILLLETLKNHLIISFIDTGFVL